MMNPQISQVQTQIRHRLARNLNTKLNAYLNLLIEAERLSHIEYNHRTRGFSRINVRQVDFHDEVTELCEVYIEQIFERLLRLKARLHTALINIVCESVALENPENAATEQN